MIKIKKICICIAFIAISMLIVFMGFIFAIAIDEVINIEKSIIMEWFPDDSEITGWAIFWILIAGISAVFEMILVFLEIKLIKKIRRLSNLKSLKLK